MRENAVLARKYCSSSYVFYSVLACIASVITALSGCSAMNPYFDRLKPHHTAEGFKNNYSDNVVKAGSAFLRWQYERLRDGLPPQPATATPAVAADLAFIKTNAMANGLGGNTAPMQPAITWVGHATMLVQASGLNVLTDPVFSQRASPVQFVGPKRAQPPGLAVADLPKIDVVLISHNHYDHLDVDSIKALVNQGWAEPLFIVPLGLKDWFNKLGVTNVKELDWWDSVVEKGVEFNFTPVQHWSSRSLGDRSQTLWGGWAVMGPDFHWYFSGDTGYSQDFADTQKRFAARQTAALGGGFDIALIAVGAYEPRWFMKEQHVNPAEAVQIHQDLRAKRSVGVHWGTFALTDEPLDQPPKDLADAKRAAQVSDDDFFLLAIGQTRKLPARTK
jgi:N-acyl-phosphatidylethanolamine-hydrolysing phospholipase D